MIRPFTGWHMTAIIVAFFGVVIAVNVVMAVAASETFSGTVVDNSYVASQQFNSWLAAGRAQRTLGWSVTVVRAADGRLRLTGTLPADAVVTAVASHPLGNVPDTRLAFDAAGPDAWRSRTVLPGVRFQLRVTVRARGQVADFAADVAARASADDAA